MNISGYEFQVIFCALILLGLASVALVVDYLKGMNEKLRERHVELVAKHEVVVQRVEEDNTKLLRALAEQSKAFREMQRRNQPAEPPPPPVEEVKPVLAPVEPAPAPVATELPSNVIRLKLKPTAVEQPEKKEADFDRFMEQLVTEFDSNPKNHETETTESLESLARSLARRMDHLNIPAGTHAASVLKSLTARKEVLDGLVLSIGINEYMKLDELHGHETAEQLLHTVDGLMSELAGPNAFCSRRSDDEYVLIFPNLGGPAAQQRLNEIAERLWDYQLQTLGTFNAVFSWGASEAKSHTLAEALQAAAENMVETRANRKALA